MDTTIDEREEMEARGALLPEAGGVCFTDLWSQTGARISITARGVTAMEAIDNLVASVRYSMEVYKMTVAPPGAMVTKSAAPPPQQTADAPPEKANGAPDKTAPAAEEHEGTGEEIVTFPVERIEVVMSSKGQKYVKCFGGPYSKFGVACWAEVAGEVWNLDDMNPGDSYSVELTARGLKVDGKIKKVIGFD
jgi:hypothetical protein